MEGQGLWSSEQHRWLGAMGLTVYAEASSIVWPPAGPARSAPRFDNVPESALRSSRPPLEPVPATRPTASVALPAPPLPPATDMPAPRRGRSSRLAGVPDKLMLALLRASGQNPNEPATQALMASWPLDELRANPAAKRALWPQLRALRRQRGER